MCVSIVAALRKSRELRVKKEPNEVRLEIVRAITELLTAEEKVDRLSRDKITDISHKLIVALKKSRDLRMKRDQNDARLEIVKAFTEILQVEERADRASRDKVRSIKRDISEGSEEWDILQKRYYAEELKKHGIDPSK